MIYELIKEWRESSAFWSTTLREAADKVEEAWHYDRHDGEWQPEICRVCVKEMAENT